MICLASRIESNLMWHHVTRQAGKISRIGSAGWARHKVSPNARISQSHSQSQAQVLSTVPTAPLTWSNGNADDVILRSPSLSSRLPEKKQSWRTIADEGKQSRTSDRDDRLLEGRLPATEPKIKEEDKSSTIDEQLSTLIDSDSQDLYWQRIPLWQDVSRDKFHNSRWQTANVVRDKPKLLRFLSSALPEKIISTPGGPFDHIRTREDFINDVFDGIAISPMAIRLTPHTLSVIDWNNALDDPVRRQFIAMKSSALRDHRMLTLDSLHEEDDSPVKGLVHRYPDKALFLATSICPLYCRFCTRSYAVGVDTDTVAKKSLKPSKNRWEEMFKYIEDTPTLSDIVVSGGDSYLLTPDQLYDIGSRLISIRHIRRIRFASKGLAVLPTRILDPTDGWSNALIEVSKLGRKQGKAVALHTHFNHPNEITWVTSLAAKRLFEEAVTVRNQSVLLRGVNDDLTTMSSLIRGLADINIQPYYVYQGDMVKGVEDLRTPLQSSLDLETQIRGSIAGFMMPQFVIDLPGGGGKRLSASYLTYDRKTGVSTFVAPAVTRGKDKREKVYEYYDPIWSLQA